MTSAVELVPVGPDQKAQFLALACEHFRELDPAFRPLPEWEANYFETVTRSPNYALEWIVVSGETVGFILFGVEPHRFFPRTIGAIYELYVRPDRRRGGIGRAAAAEAVARLSARGVQRIQLEVIEGNEKAAALWEGLGFKRVSVRYTLPVRAAHAPPEAR
jgi:ribosomal protein S18 acetylase RimI-like enzyme